MSRAISLTINYPIILATIRMSFGGVERDQFQNFFINPGDVAADVKTLLNQTLAAHGADVIDNSWNFISGIVALVQTTAVNSAWETLNPTYVPITSVSPGQTY